MDHAYHNKIASFIWSIADDCLRDVFVRGKYRDVILPMFVLRRLDSLLEPTKAKVLEEVAFQRKDLKLTDLVPDGLQDATGHVFYNTSEFTLKTLLVNHSQLEANLKAYLDGFSGNVKEIVDRFDLRNTIPTKAPDGKTLPGLSNLGMGYVFEELIRKFNEENNEEAGEHFTPREVIKLMTHILFIPVKDKLPNPVMIYDPACGSGGMLTESQDFITDQEGEIKAQVDTYLYGKESQPETYAICKSDMMIKGNDPENIRYGSTLATDEFSGTRFDFMLSNPPYGKSWASDQKHIVDGKDILDPRFQVSLTDYWGTQSYEKATPSSSDGQLLFLMEMAQKMKRLSDSPQGSRIASVHNGSSLFTGDAGSGASNIRQYLIDNDWVEAIIQLPNNIFYNTGITTYIWVLCNNKPAHRQGKVQLVDASEMHRKLRKNLGQKNCEFAPEHIDEITKIYMEMPHEGVSKVFNNSDFGYYKVTVERPLRLASQFSLERLKTLRFVNAIDQPMQWAYRKWGDAIYTDLTTHKKLIEEYLEKEKINLNAKNLKALLSPATWTEQKEIFETGVKIMGIVGQELSMDFNAFSAQVDKAIKALGFKFKASEKNQILNAVSWRDEAAEKVLKTLHKLSRDKLKTLLTRCKCNEGDLIDYGYEPSGKGLWIEYESDSELRDTENVPLGESIHDYFLKEVRPHVADAWINGESVKIGYEISFNKYFYQHKPLRSLEEVTREILQLEGETEGLLKKLVSFVGQGWSFL